MSKSVLVMETPENCYSCYLRREPIRNLPYCAVKLKDIKDSSVKPDWCPLKPLPEQKEYIVSIDNVESQKDIIAVGWNSCIDAITGKVKQMEILTEKERNIDGTELNLEEKETDKEVE
jgi:hypothetical protein|nr:MAG TPA: hypothetical protein [Caudoviricetes sp.]